MRMLICRNSISSLAHPLRFRLDRMDYFSTEQCSISTAVRTRVKQSAAYNTNSPYRQLETAPARAAEFETAALSSRSICDRAASVLQTRRSLGRPFRELITRGIRGPPREPAPGEGGSNHRGPTVGDGSTFGEPQEATPSAPSQDDVPALQV